MKKSKEESYITLTCTDMKPYVIYVEESQYTVVEPTEKYEKTYGYYNNLASALHKITLLLTLKGESTMTVEEYIMKYNAVVQNLLKKVKM